ncbi:hypothetical protein ACCO45_013230 [Purpureocillium lilacinum]|uniref:Uncharacterized protein n=1 Tax=Purpureocillium lilacinum TaxID=33203 RepID=A0ACC4DAC1_PURLI
MARVGSLALSLCAAQVVLTITGAWWFPIRSECTRGPRRDITFPSNLLPYAYVPPLSPKTRGALGIGAIAYASPSYPVEQATRGVNVETSHCATLTRPGPRVPAPRFAVPVSLRVHITRATCHHPKSKAASRAKLSHAWKPRRTFRPGLAPLSQRLNQGIPSVPHPRPRPSGKPRRFGGAVCLPLPAPHQPAHLSGQGLCQARGRPPISYLPERRSLLSL